MLFAVGYPEGSQKIGQFQDIMNGSTQPKENEILLQVPRLLQYLNQGGDAGTVDVAHAGHVQGNPGGFGKSLEQGRAQLARVLKVDSAFKIDDRVRFIQNTDRRVQYSCPTHGAAHYSTMSGNKEGLAMRRFAVFVTLLLVLTAT